MAQISSLPAGLPGLSRTGYAITLNDSWNIDGLPVGQLVLTLNPFQKHLANSESQGPGVRQGIGRLDVKQITEVDIAWSHDGQGLRYGNIVITAASQGADTRFVVGGHQSGRRVGKP